MPWNYKARIKLRLQQPVFLRPPGVITTCACNFKNKINAHWGFGYNDQPPLVCFSMSNNVELSISVIG